MTTSDELRDRVLALDRHGVATDDAVVELLACCADHRVPLVRARQALADQAAAAALQGEVGARAVALLEETLRCGPWDVT
jgi:glycine cleavage system regulatory protein